MKEKKFLIFDAEESSHLFNYLKKNETEILNTRKEIINFWILLKCFFNFKLSYKYYLIFYIKTIKPKIIITLIDNNLFFYEIKNFINVKLYLYREGLRTEYNDIFLVPGRKKIYLVMLSLFGMKNLEKKIRKLN